MMPDEEVTISKEEFDELKVDSLFLNCLRSVGVDNWNGYDHAIDMFNEITGEKV